MKQFVSFIQKEFYHILRDRKTLIILLGMPIVLIVIFGFALTNEVKDSSFSVLDFSKDESSKLLIQKIDASRYFNLVNNLKNNAEVEKEFRKSSSKLIVVIPQHFSSDLIHFNKTQIQLIADATDPNVANTLINYASAIIIDFQNQINQNKKIPYTISTEIKMLYNPQLKGAYNFVPGVMAMVLLLVCTMMTAITIVKEKEMGTMEIMLVSPLQPLKIILAKAVPYLFLSFINIINILLLSVFVLDVPINGSLFLLIGESVLFILVALSLGLLISAGTDTQQSAMFISLIGMLLPTVMLSGFMFPIENMPMPLQIVSNLVPAKWYYIIVKSVMIKGIGIKDVWKETLILVGMMIFFLLMAIKNFKIRLA